MTTTHTPTLADLEVIDLHGDATFDVTHMAPASTDDWALVTSRETPAVRTVRPVVAWAHGSIVYELGGPGGARVREPMVTAVIDLGRGVGRPAVELISDGWDVTTGPRDWIDAEITDAEER